MGTQEFCPGVDRKLASQPCTANQHVETCGVLTSLPAHMPLQEAEEEWGARREHQQIWLLQSYANKGTLRDGIERGLLRLPDGAPNQVAILAAGKRLSGSGVS